MDTNLTPATPATATQLTCAACGAGVVWDPATQTNRCKACGVVAKGPATAVDAAGKLDFLTWVKNAASADGTDLVDRIVVHCNGCGAETTFAANVTAGFCTFCGSAMSAEGVSRKLIKPTAVLPFKVTNAQALEDFTAWVRSRWFAPNAFRKLAARDAGRLRGMYIPFWTYDAHATTSYQGQRGDDYTVTETYTEEENGQTVTRTREIIQTRWSFASGTVADDFDDVLICGSTSVSDELVNKLQPWDLDALLPFTDVYLAGFECESYAVSLADGFEKAKTPMAAEITRTIERDIGGDHQTIANTETEYSNVSFKHVLLPLWICSYRFGTKVFRVVVNARTGEVQGERPWSWVKITLLVLAAVAAIATGVMLYNGHAVR